MATHSLPNSFIVWAPTPAAPTTFATVFTVRIAANGLLIFSFIFSNRRPAWLPVFARTATWEWVIDNIIDSKREQRNETPNAKKK